jgi:drug/metabolite transporter (DMT)-like permease
LTRLALRPGLADAESFVAIRLVAGALALAVFERLRTPPREPGRGSFASAALLFAYAAPFSFAYLRMGAGTGALVLFGTVQATMIGWGLFRGERPFAGEWTGLLLALGGLAALTLPGATRPDLFSFGLMVAAGIAWGAYSLRGRGSVDPLGTTAGNFSRSAAFALALLLVQCAVEPSALHATTGGIVLALASGALASGLAYTIWYAALPGMTAVAAALVQLTVPVLSALAAVALLGETLTPRLLAASGLVLAGVALAVTIRRRAA